MESEPKPKYSIERFDELSRRYYSSPQFFSEEAVERAEYLRGKYPDFRSYAFYHILGGSGIDESIVKIEHEDFPGEDSVELFIDNLLNRK